jgi:hypothetical protein
MLERSRFLACRPHLLMLQLTSPIQERSSVHAEGVLFAAVQQQLCKWPSPAKLITSPNLNLRASFLRFSSRSFPGFLLWSIRCSHQHSLASYPRFVTLHVLSVLIHFRSSSLTYLIFLLCYSQNGEFLFPNSLSDRNQERIYVTTRLQERLSSSHLCRVLQGELDFSWSLG